MSQVDSSGTDQIAAAAWPIGPAPGPALAAATPGAGLPQPEGSAPSPPQPSPGGQLSPCSPAPGPNQPRPEPTAELEAAAASTIPPGLLSPSGLPDSLPPGSRVRKPSEMQEPADPVSQPDPAGQARCYGMAPLIRGTLVGLYLALVLPLPFLAAGSLRALLAMAVPLGLGIVLAITSDRVTITSEGLALGHPPWCAWWLRRGWSLAWPEITGLTAVATSQGGRVFYLRSAKGSYLLPQRLAPFSEFLSQLQQRSGLDTSAVGRISPPWTYQLLAGLTALMLLGEAAALVLQPLAQPLP